MHRNNYKKSDWSLCEGELNNLIFGIVLSSISIIASVKGLTIIAMLVTVVYVFLSLKSNNTMSLFYIALSLSNTHVLNLFGISASVLICCGVVIKHLIDGNKVNSVFVLITGIYLIYSLQFIFRFDDYTSGFISPIKLVFVYAAFSVFSKDSEIVNNSSTVSGKAAKYGAIGCIANLIVTMALTNSSRARILNNDSNMLAVEAVVYISIFIVGFFTYNAISTKEILAFLFFMGGIVLLCGSRNGFLLLAIVFIFSIIFNYQKMGRVIVLLFIAVLIACILITSEIGRSAIETFESRTSVMNSKGDMSNGRSEIWRCYIEKFSEERAGWLLGFGNYTNVGLTQMGHNGLIEDIASYGIIGIVIILIIAIMVVNQYKRCKQCSWSLFNLLPIIIILIGSITLRSLTNIINTTLLFIGMMVFYVNPKQLSLK